MSSSVDVLNIATLLVPGFDSKLSALYRVHKVGDGVMSSAAQSVRALVTSGTDGASAALIDQLPSLEIIACVGVGYDAVDVKHAASRGIRVTNTPDVLTDDVADLAIALMNMAVRKVVSAGQDKKPDSNRSPIISTSMAGKRLGILGLGRIGKAIAKRASASDMIISYTNRNRVDTPYRFVPDLLTLAWESDFLIVATSGGAATRHLISKDVMEALGPKGILINVARGSVIDEKALIEMLGTGKLGGAGLDVFEKEPNVPEALLNMPNVVVTPHVGSATVETRMAMGQLAIDNLQTHFSGQPLISEVPESISARQ